jgi:putative ABC transport system substrate-binding protein
MRRILSRCLTNFAGRASVSGQNLTIDWHSYGPRTDLISEFVAELAKRRLDVLVMNGDAAIRGAQKATTTIPILGITEDMVGSGLVDTLARPSGNTAAGNSDRSRN